MSVPVLTGYGPSVYTRAARMALTEAGLSFDWREINPFESASAAELRPLHPFVRVPVLEHDGFRVFETAAILTYVSCLSDRAPAPPRVAARAVQIAAIADHYAYWPLVRQVLVEGVIAEAEGRVADADILAEGMAAAGVVLPVLEQIAAEGLVLSGPDPWSPDWHLFPIVDAFAAYPPGRAALRLCPGLARWHDAIGARASAGATRPDWTLP